MELMKRLLKKKGLAPGGDVPRRALGRGARGPFRLGACSTRAPAAPTPSTTIRTRLQGVHSYRQAKMYFPVPGGTFAGESLPGEVTWARAYMKKDGELWMDVGRGKW